MHAFGLLNNSFQPTNEIRIARTLGRHRGNLVAEAASAIQRMQKALTEMNIQLANVLSDLRGVSGMKIIGAMLDGERDPWALAALVRPEVRATPQDIAKSLEGNWREELLFVLEQEVASCSKPARVNSAFRGVHEQFKVAFSRLRLLVGPHLILLPSPDMVLDWDARRPTSCLDELYGQKAFRMRPAKCRDMKPSLERGDLTMSERQPAERLLLLRQSPGAPVLIGGRVPFCSASGPY